MKKKFSSVVRLSNGVSFAKNSSKAYTFAVVGNRGASTINVESNTTQFDTEVIQWASSEKLAAHYAKKAERYSGWKSVEVLKAETTEEKIMAKVKSNRGRKPTGKKKEHSCNQFLDMDVWIEMYNKTAKLPCNKIICAACRKNHTSMFGDNLKRTVAKYGSILKLLDSFECRECRKLSNPPKQSKKQKKEAAEAKASSKVVKKALTVDEIEDRKEYVRSTLPKFDPDSKPIRIDLRSKEAVEDLTKTACQRPDIFLDAGCKYCPLSNYCICVSKDMTRDVINEGRSKPKKRKVA